MIDEQRIMELCERIVEEFQPDKIILFGSYAFGTPTPDSDVDMLVVLPFSGKNFRKSLEILTAPIQLPHRPPGSKPGRH